MLEQAKHILQKTGGNKLPSLPHILLKCLNILHSEHDPVDQLARTIRHDPALYVKVFSLGHLSKSGENTSESLEYILNELGIDTIKSIINTSATQQFFSPYSHEKVEFLKQHWQHSVLCAYLAKLIAEHTGYSHVEDTYISGLIHDIGQLAIECAHPKQYTTTFAQLSEDEYFHDLENEEFGTTHQQVGALLLKNSGLNHFISDAALYHHEETRLILDAHPLVKIISLSNQLSSSNFKAEDLHVFESAQSLFEIPKAKLLTLLQRAQDEVAAIAYDLELDFKIDGSDGETTKQAEGKDQLKQVQLAEQVRNIALLEGIQKNPDDPSKQDRLVTDTQLQTKLLFGISNTIIFHYDESKNRVKALSPNGHSSYLEDLSIPVEPDRSLVTEAILVKQPLHSFDIDHSSETVIDQQLASMNNSEGLICLPLFSKNTTVGTLVFGVNKNQQKQLWKQLTLLKRFAEEIAQTIQFSLNSGDSIDNEASDPLTQIEKHNREIAHEIRNPLSVINNYLEILTHKIDDDDETQQNLATIRSEITRIGGILDKLSSSSSSTEPESSVDINSAIYDLTQFFRTSLAIDKSITIDLELDDEMPHILCNIDTIKQIYTNLVKNAIEALPTNGHILVYTSSHVNVNGQEFIEFSVTDNGSGIAKEILPGLFTPVKTTKGGGHSGLGLAIVKNLVSDLQGTISCKSNKKGTSFHILLPKNINE